MKKCPPEGGCYTNRCESIQTGIRGDNWPVQPDGHHMRTSMDRSLEDDDRPGLGTNQKALKINLDPMFYGTFAEIGAGQEVARWFFKVGAAAGTISKSISAYDMAVSDAIYGRCKRYVSRERLQGMLDYEHGLNLERLRSSRGDSTAFFTFGDTVAAPIIKALTSATAGWECSTKLTRGTRTARPLSMSECS